jgi:crotonobetainyl-CoA:carnitine CoA-transferase CaiB-like acyl-CoA transferase
MVSGGKAPLEGIRVFDLTAHMVGPWASMLLGALGADVLHVEQPDVDWSELGAGVPPTINGTSIGYIAWNLNKRCILLDLKVSEDRIFAHRIVATADVFMCNMRLGVAERLGMGYEELSTINPRLIYCAATGYGRVGPRAKDRAADNPIQALTGFWSVQGARGGEGETYRHYTQLDGATGNTMAEAVLLGLCARKRTGKGQMIDVTMFDAAATLQTTRLAEHLAGVSHDPQGSSAFATAPDRAFRCEDAQWIGVAITCETDWERLCSLIEGPSLASDVRFRTNRDRVTNRDALEAVLGSLFASKPQSYWVHAMSVGGIPFGIPMGWEVLRNHRQVVENGYLTEIETPVWGKLWVGGPPWRFTKTPVRMYSAPIPGEATYSVKAEVLEARDGLE